MGLFLPVSPGKAFLKSAAAIAAMLVDCTVCMNYCWYWYFLMMQWLLYIKNHTFTILLEKTARMSLIAFYWTVILSKSKKFSTIFLFGVCLLYKNSVDFTKCMWKPELFVAENDQTFLKNKISANFFKGNWCQSFTPVFMSDFC